MNGMIILWESVAIFLLGALLHFTYEISHKNKFIAIFSAVNESTWEHIKLALSGIFFCTLVDVWILGGNANYWLAKTVSFMVPVAVIPVLFYSYRAVLKMKACLPIDVTIFGIAAVLTSLTFAFVLTLPEVGMNGGVVSVAISVIVLAAYLLLTRFPIRGCEWFRDPLTGKYGTSGHKDILNHPTGKHDRNAHSGRSARK